MVLGIGTDILKIDRLTPNTLQPEDPFFKMTFTSAEALEAASRPDPRMYYATRFAGKEAVFKALLLTPDHVLLSEIEILTTPIGSPFVTLYGHLKEVAVQKGIAEIVLSLSYDTDYAIAYALAQGNSN